MVEATSEDQPQTWAALLQHRPKADYSQRFSVAEIAWRTIGDLLVGCHQLTADHPPRNFSIQFLF